MEHSLTQHFSKDELAFVEKVENDIRFVETRYSLLLTPFINPRQVEIYQVLANRSGLKCFSSNQYMTREYARVIVAPDYYILEKKDFEIALLEIKYANKFNQLEHRQILGALLHQMGVKRTVFGDILVEDGRAQVFVDQRLSSHFVSEITKISRVSVQLNEVDYSQSIVSYEERDTKDLILSSLRLDKVLSSVLKLSRSQALKLITTEKVKLNYRVMTKPSVMLSIGDLISVRGFGRFYLTSDLGLTKSGKYKIRIENT